MVIESYLFFFLLFSNEQANENKANFKEKTKNGASLFPEEKNEPRIPEDNRQGLEILSFLFSPIKIVTIMMAKIICYAVLETTKLTSSPTACI